MHVGWMKSLQCVGNIPFVFPKPGVTPGAQGATHTMAGSSLGICQSLRNSQTFELWPPACSPRRNGGGLLGWAARREPRQPVPLSATPTSSTSVLLVRRQESSRSPTHHHLSHREAQQNPSSTLGLKLAPGSKHKRVQNVIQAPRMFSGMVGMGSWEKNGKYVFT